jgi:hypothetical protein
VGRLFLDNRSCCEKRIRATNLVVLVEKIKMENIVVENYSCSKRLLGKLPGQIVGGICHLRSIDSEILKGR